jgi:hypothetical protein
VNVAVGTAALKPKFFRISEIGLTLFSIVIESINTAAPPPHH